jgi:hypothetical protein
MAVLGQHVGKTAEPPLAMVDTRWRRGRAAGPRHREACGALLERQSYEGQDGAGFDDLRDAQLPHLGAGGAG